MGMMTMMLERFLEETFPWVFLASVGVVGEGGCGQGGEDDRQVRAAAAEQMRCECGDTWDWSEKQMSGCRGTRLVEISTVQSAGLS